ncbi:hypothetical protein Hanom_Chr13g01202481 [Helianthus anomalus]
MAVYGPEPRPIPVKDSLLKMGFMCDSREIERERERGRLKEGVVFISKWEREKPMGGGGLVAFVSHCDELYNLL